MIGVGQTEVAVMAAMAFQVAAVEIPCPNEECGHWVEGTDGSFLLNCHNWPESPCWECPMCGTTGKIPARAHKLIER